MLATRQSSATPEHLGLPVVAVALRLSPEQLEALRDALGPECAVEDIRRAPRDSALVVVPPCSPGALTAVMRTFPKARVLVVEMEGDATSGPVARALGAGAAGYVGPVAAAGLAQSVRWAQGRLAA
jgi:hypothetical protein